ncbi:protein-tyrosine phosphatase [Loa loa]|uniref:Protein-tyrosine phosphatase n=2 Tax=Loa loa TaxID=7209 RepID=A0A1S0UHJ0_LOALO|nr:protein-tyrosine phosphatase [Loa loa]EJD75045.1 protein-tyrosine phosphatase [Loa loa]
MSVLEESAVTKEMDQLKKDLKNGPVRDQANKWSDSLFDKGVAGLEMEFAKLNKMVEKIGTKGFDANAERNLSKGIVCQDKNRVLLKNVTNNYIHANYINTPKFTKHFICTQRPMPTTVESFYKMLIQEEAQCVVMLCAFSEITEKSCSPYFPQSSTDKPMKFGSITVKCIVAEKMREEENITITVLGITDASKAQLVVKHYYWKNWPEKGFPDPSLAVFNLICAIRDSKKPIVVHCSDGVGRSGVFVAIEYILQKLLRGDNCADLIDVVKEIRNQRAMAINTFSVCL